MILFFFYNVTDYGRMYEAYDWQLKLVGIIIRRFIKREILLLRLIIILIEKLN